MIVYEKTSADSTTVKMAGIIIGHINKVEGGFQYTPKGKKPGSQWSGDVYKSEGLVRQSLEGDE